MSALKSQIVTSSPGIPPERIERRIVLIRGQKVMLDADLAELYEVETKSLNRAVRRNALRFPVDFMFQLSEQEYEDLRFQFGASSLWGERSAAPNKPPAREACEQAARTNFCNRASRGVGEVAIGAIIGGASEVVKNGLVGCGVVAAIFGVAASETGPGAASAAGGGCLLGGSAAIVAGAPETIVVGAISGGATLAWEEIKAAAEFHLEMSVCACL
jgi:hypothetical protein